MKFFTYGIFLSAKTRHNYGISAEPVYATLKNYTTKGDYIVMAEPSEGHTLTGLLVDVPKDVWPVLDRVEGGYKRIMVEVNTGYFKKEKAYIYVRSY